MADSVIVVEKKRVKGLTSTIVLSIILTIMVVLLALDIQPMRWLASSSTSAQSSSSSSSSSTNMLIAGIGALAIGAALIGYIACLFGGCILWGSVCALFSFYNTKSDRKPIRIISYILMSCFSVVVIYSIVRLITIFVAIKS